MLLEVKSSDQYVNILSILRGETVNIQYKYLEERKSIFCRILSRRCHARGAREREHLHQVDPREASPVNGISVVFEKVPEAESHSGVVISRELGGADNGLAEDGRFKQLLICDSVQRRPVESLERSEGIGAPLASVASTALPRRVASALTTCKLTGCGLRRLGVLRRREVSRREARQACVS